MTEIVINYNQKASWYFNSECFSSLSDIGSDRLIDGRRWRPTPRRWRPTPDARPRHADVCSPPLLVFRCGEWRHTISGPIHSVSLIIVRQVQLGWIMDMWRFCRPIGSDCCWQINGRLGLRIVANHGGIINLNEQIHSTFALKTSSNVRANKPRSRHAGNPAERNMDHPMHSNMCMVDGDPIESDTLTCEMPRSGNLPRLSYNVRLSCRLDY
jgi:hypothetical protein